MVYDAILAQDSALQTRVTKILCQQDDGWYVSTKYTSSASTRPWTNVDLMLAQSRWQRANIKSALNRCLVFAGIVSALLFHFSGTS